ncbi:hypothetical protein LUZ60_007585 [Juncus effusus]|nr:hypothetical protein LUZ60_007585 [Juncus effusus]
MALESVKNGAQPNERKQVQKHRKAPPEKIKKRLSGPKRTKTNYRRRRTTGRVGDKLEKASSMGKRNILLVEDMEINRALVRRLVKELNVGLEEAKNGKEAVDLIQKGRIYDLILMDKEMPIMDGHEATRKLRLLGVTTPIVALSSNSLQSDQDLFIQGGADEFQPKPLSREKLEQILTKYWMDFGNS